MGKLEKEIVDLLSMSEPLTLLEISERLNRKPKAVFRALRKLFEEGKVSCDVKTRKYTLEEEYKAGERKEEIESLDIEDLRL
jgi:predicted transcriptional regulator